MHDHRLRPDRAATEAPTRSHHPILHIRPNTATGCGRSASDEPSMDARLAIAGLESDVCTDVYRGLAGLCLEKDELTRMIVVSVDELAPPEFEFFAIVARIIRNASVYVYSRRRSSAQVNKAIEQGAIGEATEEVLRMLAAAMRAADATRRVPASRPRTPAKAVPHKRAETTTHRIPPALRPGIDTGEPPDSCSDDSHGAEKETPAANSATPNNPPAEAESSETARVPWLQYTNEPVRRAPPPKRQAPSPPAEVADPQPSTPDERTVADESAKMPGPLDPLLTDEELEALMSDDIAAIAPDESPAQLRDGENDPNSRGES